MSGSKRLFSVIVLLLLYTSARAQFTDKYKFNNIPTSPEAALISRFGDIPISYYTGTANVSVPIYTIKEAGVEIPIILSYHGSGVKVADEATWVGLAWDLSPGGSIVQEVRGKKDLDDNNLDKVAYPSEYNVFKSHLGPIQSGLYYPIGQTDDCLKVLDRLFVCGIGSDAANILYRLQEGGGQPDIYNYNFAGYSGKFYINPEADTIVLMDKKEDIKFERQGGWKATTLDGNVFYFNIEETSQGLANADVRGVTYKLSKVILHNRKIMSFAYTDESSTNSFRRESKILQDFSGSFTDNITNDFVTNNKKTLTSIVSGETTINFNLESRDDIDGTTPKRLQSIDIISNIENTKIKSFLFYYSYFPYSLAGAPSDGAGGVDTYTMTHINAFGKRLKLDSLKEIGYSNNVAVSTIPPYKFEYDMSITLPVKNSYSTDFFGYYNGAGNTRQLPDLTYFDYGNDLRYRDTFPLVYGYTGADRYANNLYSGAYLLKKMRYPTGGHTEFLYEPNSFTNQYIPDKAKLDQAHKIYNIIDNNDGISVSTQTFSFSKSQRVSFQNTINASNVNRAAWTYTEMAGCYIELTKQKMVSGSPVVTLVKRWDLSTVLSVDFTAINKKVWTEDVLVPFDSDPTVTYSVKCFMPDALNWPENYYHSAAVSSHFEYFDNIGVDTSITSQCGVRIKGIKNYTDNGVLASNKSIQYFGGKLLNKFEPLETGNAVNNKTIGLNIFTVFYKRTLVSSDDFGLNGGNLIGYDKVEETELTSGGSTAIGKREFYYINTVNQTSKGFPNNPYLKNGLLSKEIIYDQSAAKLFETEYAYTNLSAFSCYSGIRIRNCMYGDIDDVGPGYATNLYVPVFHYKFSYGVYPLIAEWNMLQSKTTKQYQGSDFLSSTETYTYNSKGQVINTVSANSKQQSTSISTGYPIDNPYLPASQKLMSFSQFSSPLHLTSKVNNIEVAKVYYNYDTVRIGTDLNVVNTSIQKSLKQNPLFTDVSFSSFTSKKNIRTYEQNGINTSILWSDSNSYVIADIANANQNWVAYTSFEPNGKGNWVFSSGSVVQPPVPITGKKAYDLTGGLSGPVLTSSQPCIVTYWRNSNAGPYTVTGTQGVAVTGATRLGWTNYQHRVITNGAVSITGSGWIDEVRLYPENARMNSYTHKPLTGILTKSDANNNILYYEYDPYGRLALIRDMDNNIVKKLCYNYAGQIIDCSSPCVDTTANWQNITDSVRCEQGLCGNTGYDEQKQRNINTCSGSYNTTRWLRGSNPSACIASEYINVSYQNTSNIAGYVAVYVNSSNPAITYTFPIPNGSGVLGCLPSGNYNVTIYKPVGLGEMLLISCGLATVSGSSATFNNVNLGKAFNRTISIVPDL